MMEKETKGYLKKSLWIVLILFIVRCLIKMPSSVYAFWGCSGEVISVTLIVIGLYERWLWKLNPFEKTPKLKKSYTGRLEYNYNGVAGIKNVGLSIKQTLLHVSISMKTDEITSNSITSRLVRENGEDILYYTYITNPRSHTSMTNPIQYGACRMIIESNYSLHGTYWTSRQTIGDLIFSHKKA